ncbi:ATP-dependent RecD-like DNA helicase [Mycoplasma corogypsi]|uniref:ATP-dependent DNA helicase n=1 Tax=Mycoplasma corogypsi TaxID=2106 RepID=UPI003872ABBC
MDKAEKLVGQFTKWKKKFAITSGTNKNNCYGLILFKLKDEAKTILVYYNGANPALNITYEIEVVKNPRYNNLKVISSKPIIDEEKKEFDWIKYYKINVPNVGEQTAKKIHSHFGPSLFELVKKTNTEPQVEQELLKVLSKQVVQSLIKHYHEYSLEINAILIEGDSDHKKVLTTFFDLALHSLYDKITRICEKRGITNLFKLFNEKENDPYFLYNEFDIPFVDLDTIAAKLGRHDLNELYSEKDIYRLRAWLTWKIEHNLINNKSNSTKIDAHLIKFNENFNDWKSMSLPNSTVNNWHTFVDLFNKYKDKFKSWITLIENNCFTIDKIYKKEKLISKIIYKLQVLNEPLILKRLKDQKSLDVLSPSQHEGYDKFLINNVSIINGGPGNGKSYLIKEIAKTLKQNKVNYVVLTPTGRASTALSSKIDDEAKTIHSFLSIADDTETPIVSEKVEEVECIVIDEFSMVNLNIFFKLLTSCKNLKKLVLVGDFNQLPAIGFGNLLADLINFGKIPTTTLNTYFRSDNIENYNVFNSILRNQVPLFEHSAKFHLTLSNDRNENYEYDFINEYIDAIQKYGVENVIIITDVNKEYFKFSTSNINRYIQSILRKNNKPIKFKNEQRLGSRIFKLNDRVMQIENRWMDNIYNGDIGTIIDHEPASVSNGNNGKITVKFIRPHSNNAVIYKYSEDEFLKEVELAYSVTVHKFQGSEADKVIYVPSRQQSNLKALYTAVSRAKKELSWYDFIDVKTRLSSTSKGDDINTNMLELLRKEGKWD